MKMILRIAASFLVLALTATTSALAAPPLPSVGTMAIPAPFGSSTLSSWSWGASNSGTVGGGGAGAGKASFQDLSGLINKYRHV